MKTIIITTALLFGGTAFASKHSGSFAIYGVGGHSCSQMINHLTDSETWRPDYVNWVGGYVTAAGMYLPRQLKTHSDPEAVFAEVVKYCGSNPLDDVQDGAHRVVQAMMGKKARR